MIESRCGLLCSECKYRDIMKCPGCLKIKKPYWAKSCPISNTPCPPKPAKISLSCMTYTSLNTPSG